MRVLADVQRAHRPVASQDADQGVVRNPNEPAFRLVRWTLVRPSLERAYVRILYGISMRAKRRTPKRRVNAAITRP